MTPWPEDDDDIEHISEMPLEQLLKLQGRLNLQAEAVAREVRKRMPGLSRYNAEMELRSMSDEKRDWINAVLDATLRRPPAKKTAKKGDK